MTLSFSTQLSGKPTCFPERIISAFPKMEVSREMANYMLSKRYTPGVIFEVPPKLHTIRQDSKRRWKPGMDIHFVINNRSSQRLQFMPVIPVKAVQQIEIAHFYSGHDHTAQVLVDDVIIGECKWYKAALKNCSSSLEQLIQNDGFDDVNDFFEFFDQDFEGVIIHWTDLVYGYK